MAELPKYYKVNVVSENSENVSVDFEPIYEDLEPVVRCKDCKYLCYETYRDCMTGEIETYMTCKNENGLETIGEYGIVRDLNHGCLAGRRKDGK